MDESGAGPRGPAQVTGRTPLGDAETITRQERRDVVLLADRQDIAATWSRYAPGERGPDLHVHRRHTDAFYVLEGELTFALGPGAERIVVPAGGFVAVPPDVAHAFANEGSADARWLNLHAPDEGFAAYLRARRDGAPAVFDSFDPPADGGLPAELAIVTAPGEGARLEAEGHVAVVKGALPHLCLAEWVLDGPLDGRAVHHDAGVDSYYVLEGQLDVTVEGSAHAVGPGTLASIPRGLRHSLAHGAGKTRVLKVQAPDGGCADLLRPPSG